MNAKEWAQNYFERFEAMITELKKNLLVDKVVSVTYKPITDEEIIEIQNKIVEKLNDYIDIHNLDIPSYNTFEFPDHIKEFYKISDGLHFAWSSHMFPPVIEESKTIVHDDSSNFIVPNDKHDTCEGWVSILPLQGLVSHGQFNIFGDPADTGYGEKIIQKGGYLAYLDFYNYYYDLCIHIGGENSFSLAFGSDHSARYNDAKDYDFVIYMESVLSSYGALWARGKLDYLNDEICDKVEHIKLNKRYEQLPSILKGDDILSLDSIMKKHFEYKGFDYTDWDHLSSKPNDIFKKMEQLLEKDLKEEFDI